MIPLVLVSARREDGLFVYELRGSREEGSFGSRRTVTVKATVSDEHARQWVVGQEVAAL